MAADSGADLLSLRVDGGLVANNWAMQFLSDILALPVERPKLTETTALGAAYLAGLDAGVFGGLDEIEDLWQRERRFEPTSISSLLSVYLEPFFRSFNNALRPVKWGFLKSTSQPRFSSSGVWSCSK